MRLQASRLGLRWLACASTDLVLLRQSLVAEPVSSLPSSLRPVSQHPSTPAWSAVWRPFATGASDGPPLGAEPPAEEAAEEPKPTLQVELKGKVALLTLSRPEALNALNAQAMQEVVSAALEIDTDPGVGAIVITGQGKAFAAGADIREMVYFGYADAFQHGLLDNWEGLRMVRKPLIAAVNGYALGGGCELAMMCDIIVASDTATFGQPEIKLGVIPGMGGTQRLTRAVGKAKAMDMILTGDRMSAAEAERRGLVSRVVPGDRLVQEALALAARIAEWSAPVVAKAKDCVNRAHETSLSEGLRYEKREFWSCFALDDQKEGMQAFIEKRKPDFHHC